MSDQRDSAHYVGGGMIAVYVCNGCGKTVDIAREDITGWLHVPTRWSNGDWAMPNMVACSANCVESARINVAEDAYKLFVDHGFKIRTEPFVPVPKR